jgi:hypothetical protein
MTGQYRHVVADHSPEVAWPILNGSQPHQGTVVFPVTPDLRRRHELGQDILAALGKRADVTGVGRRADEDWSVLPAWFDAYKIGHLVVAGAEQLPTSLWPDLVGLAEDTDVNLWHLAWRPAGETYHDNLARHRFTEATLEDLQAVIPPAPADATSPKAWFPAVPADNYPTFLAACRDLFDHEAFAQVREHYTDTARTMSTWLDATAIVDESTVIAELRSQLAPCVSYDEMVTVLRATQAAGHNAGWLIAVDPMRFCATADAAPAATVADPQTWERLAAYRDPYRAAACALAAVEWSVDEICAVTLADVATDGATATRPGQDPTTVPPGAEVYLRAQVAHRRRQGAAATAPLFADGDRALSDRTIVDAVRVPATDLGISLLSGPFQRRHFDDRTWKNRWGISVQDIR